MKILLDKHEKYTAVQLQEEKLDSAISAEFKSEFVFLNSEGVRNIIVDMGQIEYVDSSGLSALLVGNRLCKSSNGSFILAKPTANVRKLIQISQLESVLSIVPSLEEAVDLVFIEEIERELGGEEEQ